MKAYSMKKLKLKINKIFTTLKINLMKEKNKSKIKIQKLKK